MRILKYDIEKGDRDSLEEKRKVIDTCIGWPAGKM